MIAELQSEKPLMMWHIDFFAKVLGMKRGAPKMETVQESLNEMKVNNNAELLKRVITGDKTGVYGYHVEIKAPSSQWKHSGSPRLTL